ncbi:putative 2-oxoglutarate-dependent dioxygenase AOP1 [Senna tora]|uniref:Putative 2-oxoglutarate-dependent dioxygenase AOP1 n=1 Tax=Senna tora TaxID=362788 RepID=A0A835CJ97_9FABA|nr:putative 2-oxoglutarate-dependent dioxygenase AOP1 [Senna tora]
MNSQTQTTSEVLPIIDFTDKNLQEGSDSWISACQVIRNALESHGCFYAKSNKIPNELHNSVFTLINEIFDLPLETKRKNTSDKPYHGYYESNPHQPLYESLGIEDPLKKEAVQNFTNTMWPQGYHHFCETMNLYAKLLVEMEQLAMKMVCDGYGVDKRHCVSMLESTNYMLRSFKYKLPQKTESNLGLHAHTDTTFFTILHQNGVTGLQVKLKNGEWIDSDPSPSMFLFLAGDAFKVWSNDRIEPCEHRIIIREEKERCSMGLFSFSSKMVETEEELVDEDHPLQYKPFDHYEYISFRAGAGGYKCCVKEYSGIHYADDSK